ncbi:MAG TPA: regulatory protein RecX [Ktedonobacterales bacterium]|nr:regulatory protein RecX [Ktedonobacterales bacterium]
MHITKIEPTKHDANRVAVFVDDKYALACDFGVWLESGLHEGDSITQANIDALKASESLHVLKERALRLLAGRPHGRAELRRQLARGTKAHPAPSLEQIDIALDQLAEADLLDDQAFAEFWVEQRDRFRPKGSLALRAELRGKGVAAEDIDAAITPDRDLERALTAGRRKAQSLGTRPGIDARVFRDTLGPFLLRRGFTTSVAREAVATLWSECAVPSGDMDDALGEIEDE